MSLDTKQNNNIKSWPLIKRLACQYLKPYWFKQVIAFIFMAIAAAMTAAFAKLIEPTINKIFQAEDSSMIMLVALALFGVFFVRGIATYIHTLIMATISQNIVADIQKSLFAHCLNLDLKFYAGNASGTIVSKIISDAYVMRIAVADSLTGFGKNLLTLIFLLAVMIHQDWKLSLFVLIVFPLAALIVAAIGKRLRKVSKNIQNQIGELMGSLTETFQGVRIVQAYGMEENEITKASLLINKVRDLYIKSVRVGNITTPFNEIMAGAALVAIVVYGGYQIMEGNLDAGSLMSFIAAFTLAYEPMKKLAKLNNSIQMGLGAAERIFEILDRTSEISTNENAPEIHVNTPEIKFENVTFEYNESDGKKALDNLSITLPAGKVTALVGHSGSGKTTILNLIPRFYDVNSGSVKIDDFDVKEVKLSSLRKNIALVSQDVTIFDDSVYANIAYGATNATMEEVEAAAKAAAAHDFIMEMPDKYNTRLGEHGTKLSGGQKQRISIARAILRNAPILLLDEATSALDNESEKLVQETLAQLKKGKTTLVIAHRLSTVRDADNIIVLEEGRQVENGNHDQLIKKSGIYAKMYEAGLE